jgi:hypothetical protein
MSQQGERRGHEDDWWRRLYDEEKPDTGPAAAADSLDDRFYSASRTLRPLPAGSPLADALPEGLPAEGSSPEGSPPSGSPPDGASPSGCWPGRSAPDLRQRAAEEGEWWQGAPPSLESAAEGPAPVEWPEPTWPPRGAVPDRPRGVGGHPKRDTPRPQGAIPPAVPRARSPWEPPPRYDEPGSGGSEPVDTPAGPPGPEADPTPELGTVSVPEAGANAGEAGRLAEGGGEARPPVEAEYVGRRPPTYEAEPTALPLTDPEDIGDLVPDTVLDGARLGSLVLRAASLRGDSARYRGEPRRDALVTARFGSGERALLLIAVAGGARAAVDAHRAAADVCRWIGAAVGRSHAGLVADLRAGRDGELKSGLHRLTNRGYGRLRARAAELGLDPAEYTATLRCLLLPADPECRTRVSFGVGEGGLFRLRDAAWQDLEPAATEAGGDASVVGYGAAEPFRFRASVARPGDILLLCSAGLAEPLRGEPALAELLAERWAPATPPGLAAFLADVQIRAKGYADDRTAAAIWEA